MLDVAGDRSVYLSHVMLVVVGERSVHLSHVVLGVAGERSVYLFQTATRRRVDAKCCWRMQYPQPQRLGSSRDTTPHRLYIGA